jgi:hypothetical protein
MARLWKAVFRFFEFHPWLYWNGRIFLERFPSAYLFAIRLFYRRLGDSQVQRIVGESTQLVIEGFPRSANSFAHRAFRLAQYEGQKKPLLEMLFDKPMDIATHSHSASQVIAGCRRGLPTLVLIREPRDAIASWKALDLENAKRDSKRDTPLAHSSLTYYIRYYIKFHKSIYPYRDQFVLATFEEVTRDYGKVIGRLNERFGTHYRLFEHTKENTELLFKGSGKHLSPSAERDRIKASIDKEWKKPENARLLKEAEQVYNSFIPKNR